MFVEQLIWSNQEICVAVNWFLLVVDIKQEADALITLYLARKKVQKIQNGIN